MFYPLSHPSNWWPIELYSGIYIYCVKKYHVHFRVSRTINAEVIFRCSIGCEIMLMIKARIRLIFSRYIFIQILIEHSVSKQWRPWSDAVFCRVLSGSTLFAYVTQKGGLAYMGSLRSVPIFCVWAEIVMMRLNICECWSAHHWLLFVYELKP